MMHSATRRTLSGILVAAALVGGVHAADTPELIELIPPPEITEPKPPTTAKETAKPARKGSEDAPTTAARKRSEDEPTIKGTHYLSQKYNYGPQPGHIDRGYPGQPIPAFPGAEGWGADTPGGRGGKVMIVTNLNPDGPGSLQEACATPGPRIVVFAVSGVISNTITIEHSNITIAGQTAPGAGITIEGMLVTKPGIRDIVVRFVRVRPRPPDEVIRPNEEGGGALNLRLRKIQVELKNPHENWFAEYDAIKMSGNAYVVLDHVSCSWSHDELIEFCYTHHVTVQWCTLEETDVGKHQKYGGHHNFSLFCAYNQKDFITVHHCLLANSARRNPAIRDGVADIRNNVIYNFKHGLSHDDNGRNEYNVVGNVFRSGPGPETFPGSRWGGAGAAPFCTTRETTYFCRDNWFDGKETDITQGKLVDSPVEMPPVTTQPAMEAYELVLARAGAWPRDAVTRRTIKDVHDRTGKWGRRDPEGGLMAGLTPRPAPQDTDRDGMPDDWERKNGLDPAKDDSAKIMPNGYTAIELYLNELAEALASAGAAAAPTSDATPVRRERSQQ
jgi:pectate lyase